MNISNRLYKVLLLVHGGPASNAISAELNVIRVVDRPKGTFSLAKREAVDRRAGPRLLS
jgi:hypothetical protein